MSPPDFEVAVVINAHGGLILVQHRITMDVFSGRTAAEVASGLLDSTLIHDINGPSGLRLGLQIREAHDALRGHDESAFS
jgi:hypothetical protein